MNIEYEQDLDVANTKLKIAIEALETVVKWTYYTGFNYPMDMLDVCVRVVDRALSEIKEV
jgi:hypothetical protein